MGLQEELSLRSDEALFSSLAIKDLQSGAPDPQNLLALLGRVFGAQTAALFHADECLYAWGKSKRAALESSITGLKEPAVEACLQSGCLEIRESAYQSPVFGSAEGLACPVADYPGLVLYLGEARFAEPLKLELLSRHFATYFKLYQDIRKRSEELKATREQLQGYESRERTSRAALARLSEMGTRLELKAMLEEFSVEVRQALDFERGFFVSGEVVYPLSDLALEESLHPTLFNLAGSASVTLTLERLEKTPFAALAVLGRCVLVCPLSGGASPQGACLLLFRQAAFAPHHRAGAELWVGYLALAVRFSEMHRRIQQTQAEMAKAGRLTSLGQMAAGLAHEINNPLGSIVLALDTVQRFVEKKPQVALSVLSEALAAAERAQEIVRKMLHFSRDSRQGFRQMRTLQWLADLKTVVTPRLTQEGAELKVREPSGEVELFCNPGELTQVAVNLIFNAHDALKGTTEKEIFVEVQQRNAEWVLTVTDRGPGIPEELQERIFEPFFTTKEVGEGTGLGLHIARQIVEAHGGTLSLRPSERGAFFEARIPLRPQSV